MKMRRKSFLRGTGFAPAGYGIVRQSAGQEMHIFGADRRGMAWKRGRSSGPVILEKEKRIGRKTFFFTKKDCFFARAVVY